MKNITLSTLKYLLIFIVIYMAVNLWRAPTLPDTPELRYQTNQGQIIDAVAQMRLHELGSALFSSALWLALPMMALLLFVNLTMGVITRIAPQMNIFAVGFPITLTLGMIGITATLPVMEQPFFRLLEQVFAVFGV